ncbi:amino acid ABC transporter membrane protein 2 (PAAT family) [Paenibacillus cellulosilyticus]|uniref:Amino acid ABC transporter membrane protein 2 (PAAT family) n=1 Tax=Paenibacillus cellulosilyticus TaxID=375489 RepID=A0A2V2YUB6_9BACL|nr:amino acid ABC transporter permease [Paenibacillus cellulosilyticus]PWW03276.1 amino acid ABC transporter membrane protein 2 (PAAT family) [Paenibacillus cellulosilyticus]QKS43754.1 amino acid ABC transporter permease [Paenibacillus cellulosilyticus]
MQNSGVDAIIRAFPRLLNGLEMTVQIAAISFILSVLFGFLLGVLMNLRYKPLTIVLRLLLDAFRLIHPIIWLFVLFYGLSYVFHLSTDGYVISIIVFTLWGSFEIGDLVRGYISSLPRHQFESSLALGLNRRQMYAYILLPQIVIRTTPSIVNLATRLIKTTSLVSLIGVQDMLKISQSIIQVTYYNNPTSMISFTMYLLLLLLYFMICFPLSLLSTFIEKKVSSL